MVFTIAFNCSDTLSIELHNINKTNKQIKEKQIKIDQHSIYRRTRTHEKECAAFAYMCFSAVDRW